MSTFKLPKLPPTEDGQCSLRYEVNPAIALNALTEIYQQVQQYQIKLRQLAHKIQKIYAEGPVVSGWLASEASLNAAVKYSHRSDALLGSNSLHNSQNNPQENLSNASLGKHPPKLGLQPSCPESLEALDVALFRHGDANDLMNYLSALESAMLENGASKSPMIANHGANGKSSIPAPIHNAAANNNGGKHSGQSYYLCQLDSSGQIQAELCPPDQVPVLSMAIARYRRLNQLIQQKQVIETKLQAVVAILGDAQQVLAD
ncbi:MAG: hypothetical protein AAF572_20860 [Cyanobacteria bacterium P01_B01_bin.77]